MAPCFFQFTSCDVEHLYFVFVIKTPMTFGNVRNKGIC